MDTEAKLEAIQSLLLDRLSSAASMRDFATVAALSGHAKECEALKLEYASFRRRLGAIESALNGSGSGSTPSQKLTRSADPSPLSARAAGEQARNAWVAALRTQGIHLHGQRRRFQTVRGQSVAVSFATERSENRWFLGLPDKLAEIVVLLCKSDVGDLYDIVMPMSDLREVWRVLSRSQSQNEVKLNVKRAADEFFLQVPGHEPFDVTRYVGNYEALR